MKRLVLSACLVLFYSNVAFAFTSTGAEDFLSKFNFETDSVFIAITDGVKDGCLPRPQSVIDAFEVELRRLGIKVNRSNIERFSVSISLFGGAIKLKSGESSGDCLAGVTADFSVFVYAEMTDGDGTSAPLFPDLWEHQFVFYSPGSSLQSQIEAWAREAASDLYLELSRAKD